MKVRTPDSVHVRRWQADFGCELTAAIGALCDGGFRMAVGVLKRNHALPISASSGAVGARGPDVPRDLARCADRRRRSRQGAALSEWIRMAATSVDFDAFATLVSEYVAWCRVRYRDRPWFVDQVFGHQALATELGMLSATYSPPAGKALVAVRDGEYCGAVAYRGLGDGTCEMKRLVVASRFKGHGTGRALCQAIISSARDDGYRLMRLDTGHLMTEAIGLYESLGFCRCAAHRAYPAELLPHLVFMEFTLT
ncbi:MAG: GNAT family N-acetyltransferase [Burkholderiales bacterium]|nr:GNAT family N-acetyltransferase [Burkholderiales bacterium]MDE2627824.1 GNAT family N-acetyltransferase [Burkholderiales bacterium]